MSDIKVPRPRRFSLYREKSESVKGLMTALAKASLEFLPIERDCEERVVRNGKVQTYRYASIGSILRSCKPALCKHEILLLTEYSISDEGVTQITAIQHGDEYISSALPIHDHKDLRVAKAEKTLKRRIALEGLLCIAAMDDDDGAAVSNDQPAEDGNQFWREQYRRAVETLNKATTSAQVAETVGKVRVKIDRGDMDPHCIGPIEELADKRLKELEPQGNVRPARPAPKPQPTATEVVA